VFQSFGLQTNKKDAGQIIPNVFHKIKLMEDGSQRIQVIDVMRLQKRITPIPDIR
jgi:hypothetical protein